ncbi:hypothetical protein JL720_4776 [Aureococcus anophagefferens]|nr:hypothetical protein JL720_4776 [Aureococcus anophagefferens]
MNLLLRDDLVDAYANETGRKEPATFEELADFAEHFDGRDLNGDGEADVGICTLNGAGPGGPQALLMQIAAAKLAYTGTSQGLFFDPSRATSSPWRTRLPRGRGAGAAALDGFAGLRGRRLGLPPRGRVARRPLRRLPLAHWVRGLRDDAARGRTPGRQRDLRLAAHVAGHGRLPRAAPRLPPGSATVLDRASGEMRRCTAETGAGVDAAAEVHCPFLDAARDERDGVWVNRVPYYYSAYQHSSISINAKATEPRKALVWDFVVFANVDALDVVAQRLGPTYLDPFRRSQLDASHEEVYDDAFGAREYAAMRDDFEHALEKAIWQFFLDVAPCVDHVECKCAAFAGGRANNPDCGYGWGARNATVWRAAKRNGRGSLDLDGFVGAVVDGYASARDRHYGVGGALDAANDHRVAIGLGPFAPVASSASSARLEAARARSRRSAEATRRVRDFQATFVACRASDFVALGALASHEDLRRRHLLHFVDSVRDDFFRRNFTVFVSHQWLGRDHPDPDGVQYAAICASLADLAAKARRPLRDIFPCDREELVLPLMGLFSEVYRARGDGAKHIYGAIVEGGGADYYFPHSFDYVTPSKTVVRRVLFGDLPRAIMAKIDADLGLAPAPRAPDVRDVLGDSDGRAPPGSFGGGARRQALASDSLRHDADDKKGAVARLAATPTTEFREVGLEVP